jgi:hypothetical protein
MFSLCLICRLMSCIFVSIQFSDKIVLIVIYESLNGQYPLCSNPEVHRMILSSPISIVINDTVDDLISIQYPL